MLLLHSDELGCGVYLSTKKQWPFTVVSEQNDNEKRLFQVRSVPDNKSGCEVATMSRYAVVMVSFSIAISCLKVGIPSCIVGYTVAHFSIIWLCSCMAISQFSTVSMVKSVQLHIFFCIYISWHCDNLTPASTPWYGYQNIVACPLFSYCLIRFQTPSIIHFHAIYEAFHML